MYNNITLGNHNRSKGYIIISFLIFHYLSLQHLHNHIISLCVQFQQNFLYALLQVRAIILVFNTNISVLQDCSRLLCKSKIGQQIGHVIVTIIIPKLRLLNQLWLLHCRVCSPDMEVSFKPAGCLLKFLDNHLAVWFRICPS